MPKFVVPEDYITVRMPSGAKVHIVAKKTSQNKCAVIGHQKPFVATMVNAETLTGVCTLLFVRIVIVFALVVLMCLSH